MNQSLSTSNALLGEISVLIEQTRQQIQRSVNTAMVHTYWHIGHLIVEDEQQGESRAAYGKQQLQQLSKELTAKFSKGFDVRNLRNMRKFYQVFSNGNAVRSELTWTHYRILIKIENEQARQ